MKEIKLDNNKYLAEQISEEVVQEWLNTNKQTGEQVVVKVACNTGRGKTYWINNIVGGILEKNDSHLLYVSPRTQLNIQQVRETNDLPYMDKFDITSTQAIQYMLVESEDYIREYQKEGIVLKEHLPLYDIIVVDEAHLLVNDAIFNIESLLVLDWLKKQDKVIILLSGTGHNLFNMEFSPNEIKYTSDDDYSMVKQVIIANSDDQLVNKINDIYSNLQDNEKILVITEKLLTGGQDTKLSKWSRTLPEDKVSFIYSDEKKFKCFKAQRGEIVDGTFDTPVLIGTKKIAEGINVTDPNCKYLVQNFSDEDTHLQANGRVRNREGITIVVRAYNNMELNGKVKALKDKYGVAIECYGNEALINLTIAQHTNSIELPRGFYRTNTGEIKLNMAEMTAVMDILLQYKYAIGHSRGHNGVLRDMYKRLQVPADKIIDLDDIEKELTDNELIEYFEKAIELKERFITDEQKETLAKFCNCRDKQGRLVKAPKAINKILSACGINYEIKIKETSKMVNGKKTKVKYWIVTSK